jgi:hypothetical protein
MARRDNDPVLQQLVRAINESGHAAATGDRSHACSVIPDRQAEVATVLWPARPRLPRYRRAMEIGIKGRSTMSKAQLVKALRDH